MRGVPAAGGVSESLCFSSGAPESPVAPAGWSHRAGRKEVVHGHRQLLDTPPRRPPGFPGAPCHTLVTRQLRWPVSRQPHHALPGSSSFHGRRARSPAPGCTCGRSPPHPSPSARRSLAPDPGAQRAPRLLSPASPASGSSHGRLRAPLGVWIRRRVLAVAEQSGERALHARSTFSSL